MQKKCEKICIYEIKAVLLHRQIKNVRADNRHSADFLMSVVYVQRHSADTPCESCNDLADLL